MKVAPHIENDIKKHRPKNENNHLGTSKKHNRLHKCKGEQHVCDMATDQGITAPCHTKLSACTSEPALTCYPKSHVASSMPAMKNCTRVEKVSALLRMADNMC